MKLCWSTLTVKNMEDSLKFYQEIIGLPVMKRYQAGPGVEIAFLGDGETKIELICRRTENEVDIGQDISWGFEVSSLDDMLTLVKKRGIAVSGGPFQPSPHVKFFFFLDPNGMKIQFVENM